MAKILTISDPDDPHVAPFRDVRERDLVGRDGHFIAEGEVVLRALLASPFYRPQSLLIDAKRIGKLEPLLAGLPETVPVYAAQQPVIDAIAGFHLHRGILALGARKRAADGDELLAGLPEKAVAVAAIGIANHDNIGGIFRNAAAFGAAAVLLDAESCDPLYRKSLRVSAGAALRVPFARVGPGEDVLNLLDRHGFTSFALSPAGETLLTDMPRAPRAAVLLGAEGAGLPPSILARARTVRIAMAPGFDSLNVATASGIALHHLTARGC